MSQPIGKLWMGYMAKVLPSGASQVQIDECRMAFYAGALSVFEIVKSLGNGDPNNDDPEVAVLESMELELKNYCESITKGAKQ